MCPFYERYKIDILCVQTRYIEMTVSGFCKAEQPYMDKSNYI